MESLEGGNEGTPFREVQHQWIPKRELLILPTLKWSPRLDISAQRYDIRTKLNCFIMAMTSVGKIWAKSHIAVKLYCSVDFTKFVPVLFYLHWLTWTFSKWNLTSQYRRELGSRFLLIWVCTVLSKTLPSLIAYWFTVMNVTTNPVNLKALWSPSYCSYILFLL